MSPNFAVASLGSLGVIVFSHPTVLDPSFGRYEVLIGRDVPMVRGVEDRLRLGRVVERSEK